MDLLKDFKYTVRNTYVADGVDLIDRTQIVNTKEGPKNLFAEDEGIKYRNHWGTIILHALGFPTRQLKAKIERPTFQNFYRNWFGYNKKSSTPAKVGRAILMGFVVNPILLIPRAVIGIAKVVTEVIPGTISRFVLNIGEDVIYSGKHLIKRALDDEESYDQDEQLGGFGKLLYGIGGAIVIGLGAATWIVGAAVKSIYLTLCTLTSPIETVRASYHYGKNPIALPFTLNKQGRRAEEIYTYIHPGKPMGFLFAGIAVIGSIITFALTGPFALKALTAALSPIAGGKIANAIANVEKIGNVKFIGPILTKIGEGFQKVASLPYISNVLNFLHMGPTIQATPAAVIGLGAVVGGLVSTVGTLLNEYAYKPWLRFWHSTSHDHTGLLTSDEHDPLLAPMEVPPTDEERRANAILQSPPVRNADLTVGEGSGTGRFFGDSTAVKSPVGVIPAAARATADEQRQRPIASFHV
jgi:hypothetical protein